MGDRSLYSYPVKLGLILQYFDILTSKNKMVGWKAFLVINKLLRNLTHMYLFYLNTLCRTGCTISTSQRHHSDERFYVHWCNTKIFPPARIFWLTEFLLQSLEYLDVMSSSVHIHTMCFFWHSNIRPWGKPSLYYLRIDSLY